MKLSEYINQTDSPMLSVEITPPLKTKSINQIFHILDKFDDYKLSFVNVTYHQESSGWESINNEKKQVIYQKHASIVGVCSAIKYKYNVEVVPHLICGGFNKGETEDALFDLFFLGIDNVLALRGDPKKHENEFSAKEEGYEHASDLVKQIKEMEQHIYIRELCPKDCLSFSIGVAGYPEKHSEAVDFDTDLKWLKYKVDQGADYIVTQMFFDFDKFVEWEKKCREIGINVPIIPGLKPIIKKKQLRRLAKNFHLTFPEDLVQKIENANDAQQVRKIGKDFMVDLSKKLLDHGVPGLHYFIMGNGDDVLEIVKEVF